MLTEIYIEALLVDENLADQVWEAWEKGEIDNYEAFAALAVDFGVIVCSRYCEYSILRGVGYGKVETPVVPGTFANASHANAKGPPATPHPN